MKVWANVDTEWKYSKSHYQVAQITQKYQMWPKVPRNECSGAAVPCPESHHAPALQMVLLLCQGCEEAERNKVNIGDSFDIAPMFVF